MNAFELPRLNKQKNRKEISPKIITKIRYESPNLIRKHT